MKRSNLMNRSRSRPWDQLSSTCELALITLPRDERYGIDSKTAQDQSWRRETVRGAPPHQRLNRLPKTSPSPPCPFPHPHRIDTKKNWLSIAPRSYKTKPRSGLSRLAGKEQSHGQRRIWCVTGNHVPFTLLPSRPRLNPSFFPPLTL